MLKERQNIDYMENKRREYQTKNATLQNQVAALGLTPELHHGALVKQSEDVARMSAAITPKLQALKAFGDLPPVPARCNSFTRPAYAIVGCHACQCQDPGGEGSASEARATTPPPDQRS